MTDTELALRRAVLAAPDDDLPRLVLADYFAERGDEARAEFIQLQCLLARALPRLPVVRAERWTEHVEALDVGETSIDGLRWVEVVGRCDINPAVKADGRVEVVGDFGVERGYVVTDLRHDVSLSPLRTGTRITCRSVGDIQRWSHEDAARRELVEPAVLEAARGREREFLDAWLPENDDKGRPPTCVQIWKELCAAGDCEGVSDYEFRRGFVEAVTLSWPACVARLDGILERAPVTRVAISHPSPILPGFKLTTRGPLWSITAAGAPEVELPGLPWVPGEGRPTVETLVRHRWPAVREWVLPDNNSRPVTFSDPSVPVLNSWPRVDFTPLFPFPDITGEP